MSKRILMVLVLGLLVLCSVFASNHSVEVQVSPFSFQKIKLNAPAEYDSQYGWGAKVGYRYGTVAYAGADLSYSNYKYEGQDNRYIVWTLMAKGGVLVDLSKVIKVDMSLGAGADLRIWGDTKKFYPMAGFYLGGLFCVSEKVGITAGADLRFTWQDNKDSAYSSMDTNVLCNLGARVNL